MVGISPQIIDMTTFFRPVEEPIPIYHGNQF